VRLYRPAGSTEPVPALLWIHGGGFLIGTARQDERSNIDMVRELGIAVASVDYRLAPEHPFPAPAEDCYAALRWLHAAAPAFGIRSDRIAVGGASAGGGLAAGVALMAHDRGEVPLAFQLLVYPMLDDRTVQRARGDESDFRLWNSTCNEFGWRSYLGAMPGGPEVSPYAAPARRVDLGGLAPAWLGVGTLDLFHDEDVDYATRLREAGVACDLVEVDGAFHGFDGLAPRAPVVTAFRRSWLDALGGALNS
jgi:acetyl esterase/lipase